jgi:hypothetical protein
MSPDYSLYLRKQYDKLTLPPQLEVKGYLWYNSRRLIRQSFFLLVPYFFYFINSFVISCVCFFYVLVGVTVGVVVSVGVLVGVSVGVTVGVSVGVVVGVGDGQGMEIVYT